MKRRFCSRRVRYHLSPKKQASGLPGCDLNDLSSTRADHNLSTASLERLIQSVIPGTDINGIAAYARLWSHLRTIKRPLVQVCKRTLQSAAPSRVFRIPGLACASKWTDYGIRWLVSQEMAWQHRTAGSPARQRPLVAQQFQRTCHHERPILPTDTITCASRRDTLTGPCRTGCLAKHNVA